MFKRNPAVFAEVTAKLHSRLRPPVGGGIRQVKNPVETGEVLVQHPEQRVVAVH